MRKTTKILIAATARRLWIVRHTKSKFYGISTLGVFLIFAGLLYADDPTSKIVHLQPLASKLLASSSGTAVQFEVWDQATVGNKIYSESHNVDADSSSNITNDTGFPDLLLGRCIPQPCTAGLDPSKFPQGGSRYLDVTQDGVSVLLGSRLPLYAAVFSLTPGPPGPAGPAGQQGAQGPPGPINNVVAGSGLIGGGSTPTVMLSIANGGVGTAQLAASAVTSNNIAAPLALTSSIAPGTTFFASNTASGPAAYAISAVGGGVGVLGSSSIGVGVEGSSDSGNGVKGNSNGGFGVLGTSAALNGTGVYGQSVGQGNGIGVSGSGPTGVSGSGTIFGIIGSGPTGVSGTGTVGVVGNGDRMSGTGVSGFGSVGVVGNGNSTGVSGTGNSSSGTGVFGSGNTGVVGSSTNVDSINSAGVVGSGNLGVSGTGFFGVKGQSTAGDYGIGVFGVSDSGTNAVGVRGDSASGTGVFGLSASINGTGVAGASTNNGAGVFGSGSVGVFGNSTGNGGGAGVVGYSTNAIRPAVMGINTIPVIGLAGIFSGHVLVGGILSAALKEFKIDHPLDPGRKYLVHSTVESPDMKNVYDGIVTLEADGQAWVELPAYFEALNKNFRYQLTAIGTPAPNLYIAQEVHGNRFQIAGGEPGGKVSWQVTGIRHDPYAEQHPLLVEEEKQADEQDYYLHPEVYGQPESKGIVALRSPRLPQPPKTSPGNSAHP